MARTHRFSTNIFQKVLVNGALTTATAVNSTWVDASLYERLVFKVIVTASDATSLNYKLRQSAASSGSSPKDVAFTVASTSTTYTAQSTSASGASQVGKEVIIELQPDQLDINNSYRYVMLVPTFAGGTATSAVVEFLGFHPRTLPVTADATVLEVVHFDSATGTN